MKSSYYHRGLVLVAVAIFFTNAPSYLLFHHGIGIPLYWTIGFCVLSTPVLITQILKPEILNSPVVIWCFGYVWLTILGFFSSSQSDMAWQEVRWRFLTVLDLVLFLALFAHPDANKLARKAIAAGVLLGVAINMYELFVPLSFSPILGRSAGLYMNATTSALALVGGMIFAMTILPSWFQGIFLLITGGGVFVTFSRGGILAWIVAVAGFVLSGRVALKDLLLTSTVGLILAGVVLLPRMDQLLTTLDRTGSINKNVEERLAWLTNPSGVSDESSWSRAYVAQQAWRKFADSPWNGSGTGSFRDAFFIPPHNQYLSFMVDHGFLGAAIMPLLIVAASWRAREHTRRVAIIFGCTQAMAGLMSHTILNEEHTLLLYALVATMSTHSAREEAAQRWPFRREDQRGLTPIVI